MSRRTTAWAFFLALTAMATLTLDLGDAAGRERRRERRRNNDAADTAKTKTQKPNPARTAAAKPQQPTLATPVPTPATRTAVTAAKPIIPSPTLGSRLVNKSAAAQSDQSPQSSPNDLAAALQAHVVQLATKIGERNTRNAKELHDTARYLESELAKIGYEVEQQNFTAKGIPCENLIVEITGQTKPREIVVIGAHYDSAQNSTGANDNGSGVAALLELARKFHGQSTGRTLRFVAFTNEEQPHFQSESMGSHVYARSIRARGDKVVAMLSLETMGYFTDKPNSQHYPPPLNRYYPSTGNFIGFVANFASSKLATDVANSFRVATDFPAEVAALPSNVEGVGWSDHWSFWQQGYPALMVTDTAFFRYPYYHTMKDTPDKLNYAAMAKVVNGLEAAIANLVDTKTAGAREF